jgi:hypothetical protein
MPTELSGTAIEESTFIITASFTDEDDNNVTPNAINWTLTDADGVVINSQLDGSVTPGTSVDIVLSGDDLALAYGRTTERVLLIEGNYDSAAGTALPLRDECRFDVTNLKAHPAT